MNSAQFWKNFRLGEELGISGAFIYNGLRRFHEMRQLDYDDEIFEVLYHLSVGFERLLKIVVALLEHKDDGDPKELEQSLITHNHLELLHRIKRHTSVNLSTTHNELLSLLGSFYKTMRYDRFSFSSISGCQKEKNALCSFIAKNLQINILNLNTILATSNEVRYKKFFRKCVQKISGVLYQIIKTRACELNLYTYEMRHGSKAYTIFLGEADIPTENVLWKELLIFFMNTKDTCGYLEFLRSVPPLEFDPELIDEYLECFDSETAKAFVRDELEHLYEELSDKKDRLQVMDVIGAPGVCFNDPDFDEELPE